MISQNILIYRHIYDYIDLQSRPWISLRLLIQHRLVNTLQLKRGKHTMTGISKALGPAAVARNHVLPITILGRQIADQTHGRHIC